MTTHHDRLQLCRVPAFVDDLDRPLVSDLPGRNGDGGARAFGFDALEVLLAEWLRTRFVISEPKRTSVGATS